MEAIFRKRITDDSTRIFTKAFIWAGVAFAIISLLGFITKIVIDQDGVLKAALSKGESFSANFYGEATAVAIRLRNISFIAMGLILISAVLRFVWWFRYNTAGKLFIYSVYTIYVIGQGLGFGMLFTVYNAIDLVVVFAVAGGMFLLMAFAGWHAKDLRKLTYFVVYASFGMFIFSIVAMVLYFTGGASNGMFFVYFLLSAVLTLFWIIWDVAALKRFAHMQALSMSVDPMGEFRLTAFFGFRLLSDLITLIWTLARLMRYFKS